MTAEAIGTRTLGELAIQWQQCKRKRKRERLFGRLHALALPMARRFYRGAAPWTARADYDQSEEDVNRAIWKAADAYDGRARFESLLWACVRNLARDSRKLRIGRGRGGRMRQLPESARMLPLSAAMLAVEKGFGDTSSASARRRRG